MATVKSPKMFDGLQTTEELFLEALECFAEGDYEDALPLLARVTAFEPANESAYELWVACHISLGRLDRALELLDAGLRRWTGQVGLNIQKSLALQKLGRFEEARGPARAALESDPSATQAALTLASAEKGCQAFDEAIAIYTAALKTDPYDERIHVELLMLASDLGRHALVIEKARDYLRTFEKDTDVLTMLGQAYAAVGDHRRAGRAFRDAVQQEPENVELHVNVMMLAYMMKDEVAFEAYLARLADRDEELAANVAHETKLLVSRLWQDQESSAPAENVFDPPGDEK